MPAGDPPHKPGVILPPGELRAEWLELAIADRPGLRVSRIELARPGPSYTADTMEALHAVEPGADLWFLLGADQLAGFPTWRDPDRILAVARLGVVRRHGGADAGLKALADAVAPGRVDIVEMPEIGVSATMIRARIAAGQPVGHLLPRGLEDAFVRRGVVPSA